MDIMSLIQGLMGKNEKKPTRPLKKKAAYRTPLPKKPVPSRGAGPSTDNRITNSLVQQGRLPRNQRETRPQGGFTQSQPQDDEITNMLIERGYLPPQQREFVPQSIDDYLPKY